MSDSEKGREIAPGIFVRRHFRDQHIVTIGDRSVAIYTEMLTGNTDFCVDIDAGYKWLPPHEQEPFIETDHKTAIEAVYRFFEFEDIQYEIFPNTKQ